MLVTLESSGGFAGMRRTSSIDTEELPAHQALTALRALERLASESPSRSTHQPRYVLTVHRPTGVQVVEVTEPNVPDELRPLIAELSRRATLPGSGLPFSPPDRSQ